MKQFRKERIAQVIRNTIGEALVHQMNDPRLSPLTTITRVKMTSDLQVANVFVSVSGGEAQERKTIRAMAHARGFLQRLVAAALSIRHCPELRFEIDEVGKTALATLSLIEQNRRDREANAPEPEHEPEEALSDGSERQDTEPRPGCEDPSKPLPPAHPPSDDASPGEMDPTNAPPEPNGVEE